MRKCDNCSFGSYGLDCNRGVETLYCGENNYENEVKPEDFCKYHQFIKGMEDEKNLVLYDESYLGPGYFIINMSEGKIVKFFKIYIMNNIGYPSYGLRAFCVNGSDSYDYEFNSIEFIFRKREDFESGLFQTFSNFSEQVVKEIYSIDESQHGKNNILIKKNNEIINFVVSKDVYNGKQHPCVFIDINLGDNYSCQNYEIINELYNSLSIISTQFVKENTMKKILTPELS